MAKLSPYSRQQIKVLLSNGESIADIVKLLEKEGIVTCRQTVWRFQRHLEEHGSTAPLPKSGCPSKLTSRVLQSIENAMQRDEETTGKELASTLNQSGVSISSVTTLKARRLLG